jgi:hypothetical protein
MPKTQRDEARAGADHAMAILDGLTDKWAEEVNLTAMIKNAVSPMNLNSNAPADVRERFKERMASNVGIRHRSNCRHSSRARIARSLDCRYGNTNRVSARDRTPRGSLCSYEDIV